MKTKNILGSLLSFVLLFSGIFSNVLYAQNNDPSEQQMCVTPNDLKNNVQAQQKETKGTEDQKLIQEALDAYSGTLKAAEFLDKGDKDNALASLKQSIEKLDTLVARYPQITYFPITMNVQTLNVPKTLTEIRQQKDAAESLIKNGYIQAARRILDYLVSEIRITSVNLPMEIYPTAIRGVASLIQDNKLDQAKKSLAVTLSTVVTFESSIPIPVLNSQSYLRGASKIITGTTPDKLTQDQKAQALGLLKRAHQELQMAEELGYGKHDLEFAQLHNDISDIENKITSNEESSSFLDKLKIRMEDFKNRISK